MLMAVVALAVVSARIRPDYAHRFADEMPARAVARPLNDLATPAAFDGAFLTRPSGRLSNDEGHLAWRTCYRMAALNEMYRVTGDAKYLRLNLLWAEAVMAARDDRSGRKRWNGRVGPVWSSEKYGRYGRTAYLVHTAMIVYPMLELLHLEGVSSPRSQRLLQAALASIAAHDEQWRDGPGQEEGYYVYTREQDEDLAGQPLPVNRGNAMAKCLWLAWKLTGKPVYRERALALARFFKNRLQLTPTGAYTWPYDIPAREDGRSRPPEDSSHGALTASLAPLLEADGEVFSRVDLQRFAATVVHGVTGENGVISGDVAGSEKADPAWVDLPARWLEFSPYHRAVYPRIASYYARYDADTVPETASLALALLIRYRPKG